MARRLHLKKYTLGNVNYLYLGAYRLKIEARDTEDTGADPNVFLFLRRPLDPVTGLVLDEFHAIASPADMVEYPESEPSDKTTYPFFRARDLTLDFRAESMADDAWQTIVREVGVLLISLDRMDTLVLAEEVNVGNPATDGGSSASVSESQSQSVSTSS